MDDIIEINGVIYRRQTEEQEKKQYEETMLIELIDSMFNVFKHNVQHAYKISKEYENDEFSALQVEAQSNYSSAIAAYNTLVYCFDEFTEDIPAIENYIEEHCFKQIDSFEDLQD